MYTFSFEKLEVWQLSRKLSVNIYKTTSSFPHEELYGLTSQLRRAADSVSSNIAEGNFRLSQKDKAHFFEMSFSSLMEVMNQLIISFDLKFLNEETLNSYRKEIAELSNKLNSLHKNIS
ncbi:MAG: four helix bundle protein [Chlorobi bacterium]|nr:four helix bundle protein [Chlorobiota bacterium]